MILHAKDFVLTGSELGAALLNQRISNKAEVSLEGPLLEIGSASIFLKKQYTLLGDGLTVRPNTKHIDALAEAYPPKSPARGTPGAGDLAKVMDSPA